MNLCEITALSLTSLSFCCETIRMSVKKQREFIGKRAVVSYLRQQSLSINRTEAHAHGIHLHVLIQADRNDVHFV